LVQREEKNCEWPSLSIQPEAEAVFRECLRENPRDQRALFGLMETLKAQKKMDSAQWVQHEFELSWKNPKISQQLEDL